MATVTINEEYLTDIAEAIRNMNDTNTKYRPKDMAEAINGISEITGIYKNADYENCNLTLRIKAEESEYMTDFSHDKLMPMVDRVEVEENSVLTTLVPSFYNNQNIELVDLSNATQLTAIGEEFAWSSSETAANSNLSKWPWYASSMLMDCKALKKVALPPNATDIGTRICMNCTNLTEVEFPKREWFLKYRIHSEAFKSCDLKNIVLPYGWSLWTGYSQYATDSFINDGYSFGYNYNLQSVVIQTASANLHPTTFAGCSSLKTIYVPWKEGDVDGAPWGATNATVVYKSANPSAKTLYVPAGTTAIAATAYAGNDCEVVHIPSSVQSIGASAFANCPNLRVIYFASNNISIATDAFYGCTLYRIYTPDTGGNLNNYPWGASIPYTIHIVGT